MKKSYLILALSFLLFLNCKKGKSEEISTIDQKQPNIIFVLADDLGYGDINAFNSEGKIKHQILIY